MTRFSIMKLLFHDPIPIWPMTRLASWIHTCVCKSFPKDSGEWRTSFFDNGIHYTYKWLKESSNLAEDFKEHRAVTAKLQVPEHTEDGDFRFEKFTFICKFVLQW